jgi:alpha-D-ribose 1-methylphosphonate 5-triphosphate synthase subunit PhnH
MSTSPSRAELAPSSKLSPSAELSPTAQPSPRAGLSPGFADPVADAQACFRAVLDAMARPGTPHQVREIAPPEPLASAAAAVLLTLVDHETPLWFDPAAAAARDWVAFHCGAPIVPPSQAAFALALALPDLATLSSGTHETPESSATLILQIAALASGQRFRLSGPGLRTPAILQVDGLPAGFAEMWRGNRAQYPCGIDLILCAGDTLTALPRGVNVEEA